MASLHVQQKELGILISALKILQMDRLFLEDTKNAGFFSDIDVANLVSSLESIIPIVIAERYDLERAS
jgi:hypothetical protein